MTDTELRKTLSKLAHDIRGPVHSAQLNLEAAQMLAARLSGKDGNRLSTHLQIVQTELARLQRLVAGFGAKSR